MGRLRASLAEVVGIKFDRHMARERLRSLGMTDKTALKHVLTQLEATHTRAAFVSVISADKKGGRHV